jgi:hypothetical protein
MRICRSGPFRRRVLRSNNNTRQITILVRCFNQNRMKCLPSSRLEIQGNQDQCNKRNRKPLFKLRTQSFTWFARKDETSIRIAASPRWLSSLIVSNRVLSRVVRGPKVSCVRRGIWDVGQLECCVVSNMADLKHRVRAGSLIEAVTSFVNLMSDSNLSSCMSQLAWNLGIQHYKL